MKFSQMPYARPDAEKTKQQLRALTEQLKAAKTYEEAKAVFLRQQETEKHLDTANDTGWIVHLPNGLATATEGDIVIYERV